MFQLTIKRGNLYFCYPQSVRLGADYFKISHLKCLTDFEVKGNCTILNSQFFKELYVAGFVLRAETLSVRDIAIRESAIKTLRLRLSSESKKVHFENCDFFNAPVVNVDGKSPPHNFSFHNCEFKISEKSLTVSNNFRKMSKIFKQLDNHIEFLRFQAYEHKYRPTESFLERVTSFIYGFFNNYGLSFSKPLYLLSSLFFVCSIIFWIGFKLGVSESFKFSFTNTLVFIRWIVPEDCTSTLCEGWSPEDCTSRVCDNWIYAISIFQSVISAILLYLFIVGIRIRFKIKS